MYVWGVAGDKLTQLKRVDLIAEAVERFGSVDILANNAGIQHTSPVESFPADRWDAIIDINLSASFHAIRAALPHMRASGWGRIINITSAADVLVVANLGAYITAKGGIVGLTKTLALEAAAQLLTLRQAFQGVATAEIMTAGNPVAWFQGRMNTPEPQITDMYPFYCKGRKPA